MALALRSRPRVTGAAIGALVGALVIASGLVVSALLDTAGMSWASSAANGFIGFGVMVTVATAPAGGALAPGLFLDRRTMVVRGSLFALATFALAGLIATSIFLTSGAPPDLYQLGRYLVLLALYGVGTAVVAGATWILLMRAIATGDLRRGTAALVCSFCAMAATVLVESFVVVVPALRLY
jgi:hypothetical protein